MGLIRRSWEKCRNYGDHLLCDEWIMKNTSMSDHLGQDETAFLSNWERADEICAECPNFKETE